MVNVKKRKGRVVIDSDSEDSASDDNLDQVRGGLWLLWGSFGEFLGGRHPEVFLGASASRGGGDEASR